MSPQQLQDICFLGERTQENYPRKLYDDFSEALQLYGKSITKEFGKVVAYEITD